MPTDLELDMPKKKTTTHLDRSRSAVSEILDRNAEPPEMPVEDEVDLASADSMGASDAPSFTPTTATHGKPDKPRR